MTKEMLSGIVIIILGVAAIIYSVMAKLEKGPLLATEYLSAKPEEREKYNKKEGYRWCSRIYGMLGEICILLGIGMLLQLPFLMKFGALLLIPFAVYAIVISTKGVKKKEGK